MSYTASLELLKIGAHRPLGPLLLEEVERIRSATTLRTVVQPFEFDHLIQLLREHTGMDIHLDLHGGDPLEFRFMTIGFGGHQGSHASGYLKNGRLHLETKKDREEMMSATVDLEKGCVTGHFKDIPVLLGIPAKAFTVHTPLTAEETVACILHEVGHGFTLLATLGEYVWLNYYLTDGIEVLLGKKPNRYRVEILDQGYLNRQVDPQLKTKLQREPTEANLRRAIMTVVGQNPRNHLTSNVVKGALKRDEQLADLYVTRMGFGRPMALVVARMDRQSRTSRSAHLLKETAKILSMVGSGFLFALFPGSVVAASFLLASLFVGFTDTYSSAIYDDPMERVEKIRRDLIAQLKDRSTSEQSEKILLADLKAVEEAKASMVAHKTIRDHLLYVFVPAARRGTQRLKHEEELEALLNNDLFKLAAQFKHQ